MVAFETCSAVNWLNLYLFSICFMALFASDEAHPCDRSCVKGSEPKTCIYNWTMEYFVSLSIDCKRCPYEIADCFRVDCVPVNGVHRMITVINRQMPGPSINVCQGDKIVVNVRNLAGAEATAIHWHGFNQVGTPYMDGALMVTQCPIHPFNSFQYTFKAVDVGTYFYHSHIGFQKTDGVNGFLVVRQPKKNDPNRFLYDFDLTKHQIMLADWINKSGDQMFREFYHYSNEDYADYLSILVNGRGRMAKFRNTSTGTIHYTPYSSFVVKKGSRYRFRVCSNANWMCPIEISVVDHDLTVISTDGDSVKPIVVKSIVINPGERFDFVINSNRPIANYWMLFRGLIRCAVTKAVGRAILKYETANDVEPPEPSLKFTGQILNPVNVPFNTSSRISLFQLQSHTPPDASIRRVQPDTKLFLPFNVYNNLNPEFSPEDKIPMVNSTAFLPPPSPLLSTFPEIPKRFFCSNTRNCSKEFCQCTYILKVKIGWVVEMFLIDEGPTEDVEFNHPWHMHGHHFRVIGGSLMAKNNTVANIKKLDAEGKIQRNFDNPILKDTVSVPHGGYTVIRFHAINPGFWAFHCHIEMHANMGMMVVFQVGEWEKFPKPPDGFPSCGDFPKAH